MVYLQAQTLLFTSSNTMKNVKIGLNFRKLTQIITCFFVSGFIFLLQGCNPSQNNSGQENAEKLSVYTIHRVNDFAITGNGNNENWKTAEWLQIEQRRFTVEGDSLVTRLKALYSEKGLYFLFFCQDKKLTSTMNADFMDLWYEDVVEVFLWPDEKYPVYFEYEISPLNYELPILISNDEGDLVRWQPFHYDEDRQTIHATEVQGGEKQGGASVESWTAEFFIPYKLLRPLNNVPPQSGSTWRANFYRMDYDGERDSWSWQLTDKSFHDYKKFGTVLFE